jgi:HEAT repeat protein
VPSLIAAFASPNRLIAHYAGEALVSMDDPPVDALKAALQNPQEAIRLHAALALADIGTREATEPLKALQKEDPNEKVRWVAKRTLRKLNLAEE